MYYELHGDPKNQSLVLIAGLKSDHSTWPDILEALSQQFYVMVFDNLGVGQNQKNLTGCSIDAMAEELNSLIESLSLTTPHLLGHSMGGAIAQVFAYKYPTKIDKLILCNTFMRFNTVSRIAFGVILDLHEAGFSPGNIMKAIIPWGFSAAFLEQHPELVELVISTYDQSPFPQTTQAYRAQLEALFAFDSQLFARNINNEALIIAAEEDLIAPVKESVFLAEAIGHSKLVVLPGGHACYVENPARFTQEIQQFLTR